jgi:hypothetical protein
MRLLRRREEPSTAWMDLYFKKSEQYSRYVPMLEDKVIALRRMLRAQQDGLPSITNGPAWHDIEDEWCRRNRPVTEEDFN